jgi:hypothetical protein
LRRPHVCEGTDFDASGLLVILQSFGAHSVFLRFSDFLDGTAQEDPMSVKGLILMHLGCGGYVTEF